MTSENTSDNLNLGRGWLNRAAEMLDSCEDHVSDAEFARAAAAIGNGFIALAHAERAMRSSATLDAAAERVRRAAAEARPHDDEPKHAVDEGVVWVAADQGGPIHAAVSQTIANAWASDNFDTYGPLALTALEVDRG